MSTTRANLVCRALQTYQIWGFMRVKFLINFTHRIRLFIAKLRWNIIKYTDWLVNHPIVRVHKTTLTLILLKSLFYLFMLPNTVQTQPFLINYVELSKAVTILPLTCHSNLRDDCRVAPWIIITPIRYYRYLGYVNNLRGFLGNATKHLPARQLSKHLVYNNSKMDWNILTLNWS